MLKNALAAGLALLLPLLALAQEPSAPPQTPPANQPPATAPSEPPAPAEEPAMDEEPATVWALEGVEWDFSAVSAVYVPVKGTWLAEKRTAVWMLELTADLLRGEAGYHSEMQGTPFRPMLLDADRTVLVGEPEAAITSVTGSRGDRILLSVVIPEGDVLERLKFVRVQRRTGVGFPTPETDEAPSEIQPLQ